MSDPRDYKLDVAGIKPRQENASLKAAVFERAVCLLLGLSENLSQCRRVGVQRAVSALREAGEI